MILKCLHQNAWRDKKKNKRNRSTVSKEKNFLKVWYKYVLSKLVVKVQGPLRKYCLLFISMETTIDTKSAITLFDRANS